MAELSAFDKETLDRVVARDGLQSRIGVCRYSGSPGWQSRSGPPEYGIQRRTLMICADLLELLEREKSLVHLSVSCVEDLREKLQDKVKRFREWRKLHADDGQ